MFNDRYGLTQAVLDGRKTQTRRIIKLDSIDEYSFENAMKQYWGNKAIQAYIDNYARYKVGEVVAVAQSYYDAGFGDNLPITGIDENGMPTFASEAGICNKMFTRANLLPQQIRITNVRVERLQDISDEDCIKEGIRDYSTPNEIRFGFSDSKREEIVAFKTPREAYAALIDRISGKGTWNSNPYVFVYEFELVK